jgi:hypothetical protein
MLSASAIYTHYLKAWTRSVYALGGETGKTGCPTSTSIMIRE